MKPTNYKQGEKYPLLLKFTEALKAMWGPGQESMWHTPIFKGYGSV
jgi:hypothetical protein